MGNPSADSLLARFRSLPAAAPLLARAPRLDGVYLVGGAVRDLMLGAEPLDLDLVVDGDLGAVLASVGADGRGHARFGTYRVELDGRRYDFARARRETYPRPGALPVVEPAGLDEDLDRRDFTVNAMALAIGGAQAGDLIFHRPAPEDLRARRLRVLHDASFADDPTRLLRLARYASRLGFEIEPHTRQLLRAAVADGVLRTVTGPRLGTELRLLGREADPVTALESLAELGLDAALAPGFGLRDPELARRALELLPPDGDRAVLALAAASMDLTPAELAEWLDALAFEAAEREAIIAAATGARRLATELERAQTPSQVADHARGAPPELVALAGALGPERQARQWLDSLRHVRLEIDGRDLLHAGVPPGPAIGRGLRAALAAKLDGRAEGHQAELAEALRAAGGSG